jgi:integrase
MTKRRANGKGSVYHRSNGRYVGEYEDATGKRRSVSGKSKAVVRAKLKERLKDKEEGIAVESQNLTVEKYLDQWLESIRDVVRPGSFKPYESIV